MSKELIVEAICKLPDGSWLTEEEAIDREPVFIMLVRKRIWLQNELTKYENLNSKN